MRATRSVDNILTLDRIRQEVALRDASVRDPKHSGRGADVVSILSKRNKAKASSSSSAYPVGLLFSFESIVQEALGFHFQSCLVFTVFLFLTFDIDSVKALHREW